MSLKAQLTEDMKTAMRAKDQTALSTIRLINAAIKQFEVDERTEADDGKVIAIITKMVKQRKDSANIYAEAGRQDLADKENAEIEILHRSTLRMILTEPKNALVRQYIKIFELDGITLRFTDDALDAIVDKTLEQKLGARGLRSIMEQVMIEPMYELPSTNTKELVVDAAYVQRQLAKQEESEEEATS